MAAHKSDQHYRTASGHAPGQIDPATGVGVLHGRVTKHRERRIHGTDDYIHGSKGHAYERADAHAAHQASLVVKP